MHHKCMHQVIVFHCRYDMLSQQIPDYSGGAHQQYFQILPSGRMPKGSDLIGPDMLGNLGRVYVFSTTLEPSFKLMHASSEAVSTISKFVVEN